MTLSRPETRIFKEIDPGTCVVHLRDPQDGYTFATTRDGIAEQLAIDPSLVVVEDE